MSLVGRTDELAALATAADAVLGGSHQVMVVSGEAGIGKSSLVEAFASRQVADGWGHHVGHCIEYADRALPFGPIGALLRSVLLDDLDHVDELVGNHRVDLAMLLPELRPGVDEASSFAGDVDRLFDAITAVLSAAARRRPLVVVVEDIHWADTASLDLLASLVRSLGRARVLLIITERTGALMRSHPLHTWLAELKRFPTVHQLAVAGLSRDELAQQAAAILGRRPEPALVDDLVIRTGGNAYFSQELLMARRNGSDALPTSLIAFLTSRLDRLADDDKTLLRAMAVAGGSLTHGLLAAMVPDVDVSAGIRRLFDASIVVVDGHDLRFRHALLREAILADVLPFEAEVLHRRAAEAIVADPQRGSSPSDLMSLALHWGAANDPAESLAAAVVAAEAASGVAAYGTAADLGLQALSAWPLVPHAASLTGVDQLDVLVGTVDSLAACYRGAEAVRLVDTALASWAGDVRPAQRALLLSRLAPIQFHLGNPTASRELLDEAQHLVGDEESAESAQVHHRVSKQALADGLIRPAHDAAERAIEIAEEHGPRVVLVEALTTKALAVSVTGDPERGLTLAQQAREIAMAEGLVSQVANTYRTEMLGAVFNDGRTDASLRAAEAGLAHAEAHCGPRWRADFRLDLGLGLVEAGRLSDAAPLIEELLSSPLDDLRRLTVLQVAGLHALCTGSLDLAETFLDDATEIAERYQSAQETGVQDRLLAELARRRGDLPGALALIDRALDLQLQSDNVSYTRESILERVRIVAAMVRAGTADEALVDEVRRLVAGSSVEGKANQAMRRLMEAELAAMTGELTDALVAEALRHAEACGLRYEAAQVRLLAVEAARKAGADREQLAADLVELSSIATDHGMDWISLRVTELAREARVALPGGAAAIQGVASRPGAAAHHDLTPREIEVLALLAEGLTNKAIGARLYVSPRTVSTHVSNLLAKLGLANRAEAAAAFHRFGIEALTARPV